MMRKSKMLVPLDGSASSRQVLDPICRLFDAERCQVTLLRVAPEPVGLSGVQPQFLVVEGGYRLIADYRSDSDRDLARHPVVESQLWDSVRAQLSSEMEADVRCLEDAGFSVTVLITHGDPAQEIVAVAETGQFDVVVMATAGRGGLGRALLGSVAQSVADRARLNVLLLRTHDPVMRSAAKEPARSVRSPTSSRRERDPGSIGGSSG